MGMEDMDLYSWTSGFNFGNATDLILIAGSLLALIYVGWKNKWYKLLMPFPIKVIVLEKHGSSIVVKMDGIRYLKGKTGDGQHQFKNRDVEIDPIPLEKFVAPNTIILFAPNRNTFIPLTVNESKDMLEGVMDEGTMNALIRRNEKNVLRFTYEDTWSRLLQPASMIITILIIGVVYIMIGDSLQKIAAQLTEGVRIFAESSARHDQLMYNATGYTYAANNTAPAETPPLYNIIPQ